MLILPGHAGISSENCERSDQPGESSRKRLSARTPPAAGLSFPAVRGLASRRFVLSRHAHDEVAVILRRKNTPDWRCQTPRQSRWRAGWGFPAAPAHARRRPSSSPAPRPAGNRAAPSGSLTAGSVRVIVGNYDRHQGPAQTFTSVNARDVRLARSKKHRPALARFLRASATQGSSAT